MGYDKHAPACERTDALNAQRREVAASLQQLQSLSTTTAQQFHNLLAKV